MISNTWVCALSTILPVCMVLLSVVVAPDQAESVLDVGGGGLRWDQVQTGMQPAYFPQAACSADMCYLFGGFGVSGATSTALYYFGRVRFSLFDTQTTHPPPRGGGALIAFESTNFSSAVLFGGTLTDGTHIYDAHIAVSSKKNVGVGAIQRWDPLTVIGMNNEVSGFGVSWDPLSSEFYTFFGFSDSDGLISSISKAVVDTVALTITWSRVDVNSSITRPYPYPRYGATCQYSAATKKTLCVGGNNGKMDLGEVWSFDHVLLEWMRLEYNFPVARVGASCRVDDNASHVIECYGGLVSSTFEPVNDTSFVRVDMLTLNLTVIPSSGNYLRGGGALLTVPYGGGVWYIGGVSPEGPTGGIVSVNTSSNSSEYALSQDPSLNINPAPDPRADFSSVVVGNGAIIAFGRGKLSLLNDVYYFDASTKMFDEITVGEGLRPSPRYGASATASASTVYFFGGILEDRQTLANDLWRLDVNVTGRTAIWELVSPSAPTTGRAFHSSFFDNYRIFVIGGMLGNIHTFTGDMVVFEILDLTWRVVVINPPLSPRAACGLVLSMDASTFTIIGGRYEVYGVVKLLGDTHQLTVPYNGGHISNRTALSVSSITRSDFTIAAFGDTSIICGGICQSSPVVETTTDAFDQCFLLHIKNGQATTTKFWAFDSYDASVGGTAWAIGDSVYLFGGAKVEQLVIQLNDVRSGVCHATLLVPSLLCANGQFDDYWCLHCAAGYVDSHTSSVCKMAPAGYYVTHPYLNATACPPGTYSNLTAATTAYACQQCSAGTYSSTEGSTVCLPCTNPTCPIGSTRPDEASTVVSTSLVSQQPEEFVVGVLPSWMWVLIGVLAFCGILFVVIPTLVSQRLKKHRRARYFPTNTQLEIRSVYELHKQPHFGINPNGLQLVLKELGVTHITLKYAQVLLAENDQDGSGHLTFPHLLDVIILFIDKGFMPPFVPNTYTVHKVERLLASVDFKKFDAYTQAHKLGVNGDTMKYQTTKVGGIFRIAFFVFAIPLILLLVGQFYYTNISEIKSEVPSSSRKLPVRTQLLSTQFTAAGGVNSESSCQQDVEGLCVSGISFTLNSEYVDKYALMKHTCSYNATAKSCTLNISCAQCSFNFATNVIVSVLFPPEVYASAITVGVSAYTGINDEKSSVEVTLPSPPLNAFRGFPASAFFFTLTPTHFESVNNAIQQQPISGEGYQIGYVYGEPGQSVEAVALSRYLSVPIVLQLTVSGSILDVSRLPQSSLLDLVSQLLGSIPGMGGVLLIFLGIYDKKFITRRVNKVRAEMEVDMCDGNGVATCTADDPSHHDNTTKNRDSSLTTAMIRTSDGYHCHDHVPQEMGIDRDDCINAAPEMTTDDK